MVRWKRALQAWCLIVVAESLNGMLRTLYISPRLGDFQARQVGVLLGSILIFVLTFSTVRWFAPAAKRHQLLLVGACWVALTIAFEVVLGLSLGYSWNRLWSDYDLSRGGLLGIGMVFMGLSPVLADRLRSALFPEKS
jgi:hypothetical protein